MQGRLLGKRLHVEFFLDEIDAGLRSRAATTCSRSRWRWPVPGYELASWKRGYGDFALTPDLATLRRIPWLEATALVLCDVGWHDGSPVARRPARCCSQIDRAEALGFTPMMGSELEFYLLRETYAEAYAAGVPRPDAVGSLHPRLPHPRVDLRRAVHPPVRNGMQGAGIRVRPRRERPGRASTRSTSATPTL